MEKPLIIFLLGTISQPRCIRRIQGFIDKGFEVEIYGIDRGKYSENAHIDGKKIHIIGKQPDGKDYLQKFFKNNIEIKKLLKIYKHERAFFYSFGLGFTLSLMLNGCKNYIYEISDILYGYEKFNFVRWIFKFVDKKLVKDSFLTVLTSEGFAEFLFGSKKPENIIIQPNKLNYTYFFNRDCPSLSGDINVNNLIFSYVGAFRYPNTIFRFARIIGKYYPQHEFHFYGDSSLTNAVIKISEKYVNVKYFGSFKNPEDLFSIYRKIDVVVACYDIQSLNERIAEPNKFYEALYFNKPIIVSEKTFVATKVNEIGCGYIIDASSDESIISYIDALSIEQLSSIKKNIARIDPVNWIDDNSSKISSYIQHYIVQ